MLFFFFFFNDPATTEIYTLSLHDALPISNVADAMNGAVGDVAGERAIVTETFVVAPGLNDERDRKSTRLNSSHRCISYAVFCLKKKKKQPKHSDKRAGLHRPLRRNCSYHP